MASLDPSPRESPHYGAISAAGGFQDIVREPPTSLDALLCDEHRDTVRYLAEQMRESGELRIKMHREMHNGKIVASDNSFKGECEASQSFLWYCVPMPCNMKHSNK
jgi:hypothetical protein